MLLQAAYTLAVLAENPCTHEHIRRHGAIPVLISLMQAGSMRVSRAANAAVVSLAGNADTHFCLVNEGLVPALITCLSSGMFM